MYSLFCAFAVIFVITVVPETKGRNLDDIAKLFVKNRRKSILDAEEKSIGVKCEHCGMVKSNIISNGTNEIMKAKESETTKL